MAVGGGSQHVESLPEELQVAGVECAALGYVTDCGLDQHPCPRPSPPSSLYPPPSVGPAIHPALIGFGAGIPLSRHTLTSNRQP